MTLTGHSLIAGQPVVGTSKTAFGLNPATNAALEPTYTLITEEQLTTATSAAAEAYPSFSTLDPDTHAAFLDAIGDNIEAIGEERARRRLGDPVVHSMQRRPEAGEPLVS